MLVLVDVMLGVVPSSILDEALVDGHRFLASRKRLWMDRYLSLVRAGLMRFSVAAP